MMRLVIILAVVVVAVLSWRPTIVAVSPRPLTVAAITADEATMKVPWHISMTRRDE